MPYPVAAARGRSVASAPALPTTNLAWAFTADPQWCYTDAGSTLAVANDPVEWWVDRTGNYWHEQTTLASKPTLVLSGGKYWIHANGTSSTMAMPVEVNIGDYDSGMTIYYRLQFTGTIAGSLGWLHGRYSGQADQWLFGTSDGAGTIGCNLPSLTGYTFAARTGATINGTAESWVQTYTAGSTVTLHRNGVLVNTASSVGSTMGNVRGSLFAVNGTEAGGGAQFWTGRLRHFLIYSETHNAAQRAAVEAFLAT